MLVLDASAFLVAAARRDGFDVFEGQELCAPPLLWPEARSALHVGRWRQAVSEEVATRTMTTLGADVVRERRPRHLGRETWRIADELGWAKTYDAEYLALATLLDAAVVTFDRRLRRAAERLGMSADISDASFGGHR